MCIRDSLYVVQGVRNHGSIMDVIYGSLPFVLLMMAAVLLLCFVPQISTALPDLVMGPDLSR